ncbi:transposase family protein [Candidatus Regiella insecticola]|uniref:Transposase n=1 Tax=Candidatus Regiella insecticola TaxID=138073 RepID=A0A6L2ZKQ5_9ENTR|nr:transposase family protein [Candidatus Regiella insecticola]GFN45142.1 transposase [Candidatus Regiella insecticola]GFN45162.1 transposase [Candidatus Regiella insecticola]GFN46080.1 transposase DDE domain protein [Candidatus Regiella insecticola]GFN46467.1 transposase DDE domain protein [Candidatus Regiella insecticola]GFN47271.1 transposase [Candidatus Regiella insecticola]
MLNKDRLLRDNRLCKALVGLSLEELKTLSAHFSSCYLTYRKNNRVAHQRKMGAGQKGFLPTPLDKLVFILLYLKCYPTYDLQGFLFGLERTRACRWVKLLLPVLEMTLGHECVLPARQIRSMEEFCHAFPGVRDVFIDGTERPVQKPKNTRRRNKMYSGKKRQTTGKVVMMTDETRRVGFLSLSKNGRRHDKRLLDKADIVRHITSTVTVWADTGFQGINKQHPNTLLPKKATRKTPLSPEQKKENKLISGIRITVEHAIAGIKRLGCMTQSLRNRRPFIDDTFILLSAGLWNFHLRRD